MSANLIIELSASEITVFTTRFCPFCVRAKQLLKSKGVDFNEIPVDDKPQLREQMTRMANGQYTVPQIWVGKTHVGGCSELVGLDRQGKLDPLLVQLSDITPA